MERTEQSQHNRLTLITIFKSHISSKYEKIIKTTLYGNAAFES